MFSFLSKEGIMGLRLSPSDREEFIKQFNSKLLKQYGSMMKEYVEVPNSLLSNKKTMKNFFKRAMVILQI